MKAQTGKTKKNKKLKFCKTERKRRQGVSTPLKKLLEKEINTNSKKKDNIKYLSNVSNSLSMSKITNKSSKKKLHNLFLEYEEKELINLYGKEDKKKYQALPLINFTKVNDCPIMKYGCRKSSSEIEYSYCKACDYKSLKPICISCLNKCHYGHVVKFIIKKGYIKCSCGEKNHLTMKINDKNIDMKCLCNEWNLIANLNYYYINKNKEPICIFCNYCCEQNKNNIIKIKKKKMIPNCSCNNKNIHNDQRIICENILNLISKFNDFDFLLHPIQFVNMLFKSKNSFNFIFEYFNFFMTDLNNSNNNSHIINLLSEMRTVDVKYTNIHRTLLLFENIIEKTRKYNIYFYNKEVTKYFSFELTKKLLEVLISSSIEEKLFWQLTNKFLYLFHKIYINEKTKFFNKFKIIDLKHLNLLSRISITKENRKNFQESQDIITFLINFMIYINSKEPSTIEAIYCINEIISIFRRLSCYNLIKNYDMVKICSNILKCFDWIKKTKNYIFKIEQKDIKTRIDLYYFKNISIKILYITSKILLNLIYNYNDNVIDMIIHNKKRFKNINEIKSDNIHFIFKKNELGESIFKITIYILSILEIDYKKNIDKRIILTKRISYEIIQYALNEDDNYLLNIIDSIYKFKLNYQVENNKYYLDFIKQTNIISNAFEQYFNFEINIEEYLDIINNALNNILGEKKIKNIVFINEDKINQKFNPEQKMAILSSNFLFLIYKIIGVIQYHKERKKENNETLNDLIKEIPLILEEEINKKILWFSFYFVMNSEEYSFIILSHYIFKELLKLPKKYCNILFKLFRLCLRNIFDSENNTIKIDSSFLIKRLYNYLDELINVEDIKDNNNFNFCIYEFLQILELSFLNCDYYLFDDFIYKIQYLIIIVGKNFELKQKYFEMENKEYTPYKTNGINIFKKTFTIYMKLINDCFDLSMEEDRNKIKEIINMNEILFALENFKINIELKTEFLRYIRKNMIDIKYSSKENNQYINSIINNKDILKEIKNNSLISFSNYPTRYLSFLKNLYDITLLLTLKEKLLETKNYKKKVARYHSSIRNLVIEDGGNKDFNLSNEISGLGESKFENSGFFEEIKNGHGHSFDNGVVRNSVYFEESNGSKFRSDFCSKLLDQTESPKKRGKRFSVIINKEKKKIMNLNDIDDNINKLDNLDKKELKILKEIIKENNNEKLYNKIKELDLLEDPFNERFYYIINKELEYILQKDMLLIDNKKINSIRYYIENGILIPIIFYFKKIIVMINSFTGKEMIKLFSLLEKCLKLKLYLYENQNIWINIKNNEKNNIIFEQCNIFKYSNKQHSIIDNTKFQKNENIKITKESLDFIKNKKISLYDYSALYYLLEKELFCLVNQRKVKIFNDKDYKNKYINESNIDKIIHNYENKNKEYKKEYNITEIEKKLLKTLIIYRNCKLIYNNENNSSIFSILPELNFDYETNFRNILISIFIKKTKDINKKNEFTNISFYLLFKLLYLQTESTQSEILNIINKTENKNFIKNFSEILNNKIILSIIEYLNPSDGFIHSNYFNSCNILWIFKLLCSKDNKFYKLRFISTISYKYIINHFSFFKINQDIYLNEDKSEYESTILGEDINKILSIKNLKDNLIIKNVKFYDFFLFLIPKICLISNWDKSRKLPQNNYLFDLFSFILDLLTEIILGNKNEILSILFDDIIIGKKWGNFDKIKNIESLKEFMKYISIILLDEKNNGELNNKVKKKLIDYINCIIEEKECDEMIEKCIEKYLNFYQIYKNISYLLKNYFVNNIKPKIKNEQQKNEEQIISKIDNNINSKISNTTLEKNLTYDKKKESINLEEKKTFEENSTSQNKMLSFAFDINNDIKKNLFTIIRKETEKKEENKNEYNYEIIISKLTFGKILYEFFKKEFYDSTKLIEDFNFQLCNSYYKFIKFIKIKKGDIEHTETETENFIKLFYIEEENINIKNNNFEELYNINNNEELSYIEKDYIEKYFIEKFFEEIITTIEIINQYKKNKIVIFTKFPLFKYLSNESKIRFIEHVNRDNETSKKYDLIKYVDYFIEEIKFNKDHKRKYFIKINFRYLPSLSVTFAVLLNLFFLFTMKGDNKRSDEDSLMIRIKDKNLIEHLINISSKKWDNTYQILCITYLILNAIFIIIWIVQQLHLFFKQAKIYYKEIKKSKGNKINKFEKFYIIIQTIILRGNYIIPLIYEFFVCIMCISFKQRKIMYPLLLIPILFLNKTLKNMTRSIKINFKSFILTLMYAFIIVYIFANLTFFFFNEDFEREINYYSDNYCKTLIFSFLNALDNGIRARGGLGDSGKKISYSRDKTHYILRLILDDLFFLFIVIIMLDLIFGIVIKSFDKLEKINYQYYLDKTTHCFICNIKKNNLEKNGINFKEHINIRHNLWNYIEYMIKIKFNNKNDLNPTDIYVLNKMKKRDITWLPTYKISDNENISNEDDYFEDNNLEVLSENFLDYKINQIDSIHIYK